MSLRLGQSGELEKAGTALLTFEAVFQFASVSQGESDALPRESPGPAIFRPARFAMVVLVQADEHVFAETDIESAGGLRT